MIDPKSSITYAQYNEDLILRALFADEKKGFYIDVGAHHPTIDSVTKYFYDQGWRGINIEPINRLYKLFETDRPKDINISCGLGDKKGKAILREYVDVPGHSTFDDKRKIEKEDRQKTKDYEVPILTLQDVCEQNKVDKIQFLKIDVEGYEGRVIAGNDWQKYRPEVVCVESNHVVEDWKSKLLDAGYFLFITDGLNEYYVAKEAKKRTNDFAERAVILSYHGLKPHHYHAWAEDVQQRKVAQKELKSLHQELGIAKSQIAQLNSERLVLKELSTLTLKNQGLRRRLKRAMYGLTVDWVRFKLRR